MSEVLRLHSDQAEELFWTPMVQNTDGYFRYPIKTRNGIAKKTLGAHMQQATTYT